MKKKDQNADTPATKRDIELLRKDVQADLELWGGNSSSNINDVEESLSARIGSVEENLSSRVGGLEEEMHAGFASLKKVLEHILFVVQSIEGRAQETRGDHEQIEKHEKRITDAEVQIRMLQK